MRHPLKLRKLAANLAALHRLIAPAAARRIMRVSSEVMRFVATNVRGGKRCGIARGRTARAKEQRSMKDAYGYATTMTPSNSAASALAAQEAASC